MCVNPRLLVCHIIKLVYTDISGHVRELNNKFQTVIHSLLNGIDLLCEPCNYKCTWDQLVPNLGAGLQLGTRIEPQEAFV